MKLPVTSTCQKLESRAIFIASDYARKYMASGNIYE